MTRFINGRTTVLAGHGFDDATGPYLLVNDVDARGYRQESCALFRQPHKPAVRCGYPSSRVTSR